MNCKNSCLCLSPQESQINRWNVCVLYSFVWLWKQKSNFCVWYRQLPSGEFSKVGLFQRFLNCGQLLTHLDQPIEYEGFPGGTSGKEPTCQCRRYKRCRFDPWAGKISWRRAWQTTPVFLPNIDRGLATYHRVAESKTAEWLNNSNNNNIAIQPLMILSATCPLPEHFSNYLPFLPLASMLRNLF